MHPRRGTLADAYVAWDFDIAAPPQMVWEYFTVPGQPQKWWPAVTYIQAPGNK